MAKLVQERPGYVVLTSQPNPTRTQIKNLLHRSSIQSFTVLCVHEFVVAKLVQERPGYLVLTSQPIPTRTDGTVVHKHKMYGTHRCVSWTAHLCCVL